MHRFSRNVMGGILICAAIALWTQDQTCQATLPSNFATSDHCHHTIELNMKTRAGIMTSSPSTWQVFARTWRKPFRRLRKAQSSESAAQQNRNSRQMEIAAKTATRTLAGDISMRISLLEAVSIPGFIKKNVLLLLTGDLAAASVSLGSKNMLETPLDIERCGNKHARADESTGWTY